LGEGVRIKKSQFDKINPQDLKKFTNELLLVIFGRETLATHSLNGRKASNAETSKEALPAHKLSILIGNLTCHVFLKTRYFGFLSVALLFFKNVFYFSPSI